MPKALIQFSTNRKAMFVTQEKARDIFAVLTGEAEPENPAQAEFVGTIERVFLERSNPETPQAYRDMYPIDAPAVSWFGK